MTIAEGYPVDRRASRSGFGVAFHFRPNNGRSSGVRRVRHSCSSRHPATVPQITSSGSTTGPNRIGTSQ